MYAKGSAAVLRWPSSDLQIRKYPNWFRRRLGWSVPLVVSCSAVPACTEGPQLVGRGGSQRGSPAEPSIPCLQAEPSTCDRGSEVRGRFACPDRLVAGTMGAGSWGSCAVAAPPRG